GRSGRGARGARATGRDSARRVARLRVGERLDRRHDAVGAAFTPEGDSAPAEATRSLKSGRSGSRTVGMTTRWVLSAMAAVLAIAVFPEHAWAWTPGTHVFLGEAV